MTEMLKYDGHKLHKALFKKSTIIQHLCKLFDKLYWTTIFIFLTIRAYTTIYDGGLLIVKAILICSEAKRLYNNIQCRSLIAWNCSVLYTPSVIGWREVPALLTAGYKTDSTQRMFHCSLQLLSANNTVMEHLRLKKFFLSGGGGSTKLILLRQLLLARNHSEIHYLPADPLTCTSIWPPPKLATFLQGGGGVENQITFYTGRRAWGIMGVSVLQHGSDTVEQQRERASIQKGNEKKCWMNGRWCPEGSTAVMLDSKDGRTTAKTNQRKRNKKYGVGIHDGETENVSRFYRTEKKTVLTVVSVEKLSKTLYHVCRHIQSRGSLTGFCGGWVSIKC